MTTLSYCILEEDQEKPKEFTVPGSFLAKTNWAIQFTCPRCGEPATIEGKKSNSIVLSNSVFFLPHLSLEYFNRVDLQRIADLFSDHELHLTKKSITSHSSVSTPKVGAIKCNHCWRDILFSYAEYIEFNERNPKPTLISISEISCPEEINFVSSILGLTCEES